MQCKKRTGGVYPKYATSGEVLTGLGSNTPRHGASRAMSWGALLLVLPLVSGCLAGDLSTMPTPIERSDDDPIVMNPIASDRLLKSAGFATRFPLALPHTTPGPVEETAVRIDPMLTPWGEPWNHDEIVLNMDGILREAGVDSLTARSRMTAHAIIASGWKQSVFHYNAWGVKRGSWDGPWFQKSTTEMNRLGFLTTDYEAQWRAFDGWEQAIEDYLERINRKSQRPSYRKAARFLFDKDFRSDDDYWQALSEGNYYTGQAFTPEHFGFLCYRVRQTVRGI